LKFRSVEGPLFVPDAPEAFKLELSTIGELCVVENDSDNLGGLVGTIVNAAGAYVGKDGHLEGKNM
jgi:hypothetical protein